jgi:hypothetical protein
MTWTSSISRADSRPATGMISISVSQPAIHNAALPVEASDSIQQPVAVTG